LKHEQPIRLAAKLYEVRDAARKTLGDKYRTRMEENGKLLSAMAKDRGCGVMDVALDASKSAASMGDMNAVCFILAAAVDLLEPSEDVA
jgi:hypothetical protein